MMSASGALAELILDEILAVDAVGELYLRTFFYSTNLIEIGILGRPSAVWALEVFRVCDGTPTTYAVYGNMGESYFKMHSAEANAYSTNALCGPLDDMLGLVTLTAAHNDPIWVKPKNGPSSLHRLMTAITLYRIRRGEL